MLGRYQLYLLLSLLVSIDIHEFFHAWMANFLGDPTAKNLGRLSLNPIVHLDLVGTIMMIVAVLSRIGLGWGKPVPVNPYNARRDPRTVMGIVGFSGPFSNLILAFVVAVPIRFGSLPQGALRDFLTVLAGVNIGLAVFNLIPLPPLDGFSVLMAILNAIRRPWAYSWFQTLARVEAYGPMLLLLLIMFDAQMPFSILGLIMGPPTRFLSKLILG